MAVVAAGESVVLDAVDNIPEISEQHRRAVAVSDNQLPIAFSIHQLAVRLHGKVLMNSVEGADRQIGVAALQCGRDVVDADAAARQCRRIELRTHGVLLFAGNQNLRDPADG